MSEQAPKGHIKLARKAFDKEHGDAFWLEKRSFSKWEAWVDLIRRAAWKAAPWTTKKYGTIELARGEFVAAIRKLSEAWAWSRNAVHRFLKVLQDMQRIVVQKVGRYGTVYLIVNYERYQPAFAESGTHLGTETGRSRDKTKSIRDGESSNYLESNISAAPRRIGWNASFSEFWTREVGTVTPGLVGKMLKPQYERVGYERLLSGAKFYIRLEKAKGRVPVWAYFVSSAAVYIDRAEQALSPTNGEVHGELDALTAPLKLVRPVA